MDYKKLLKKAREQIPKSALETTRFEVPKVLGHIQGNKTIISNFHQIASILGRKPEHIIKFLSKELGAPMELSKTALLIGTKVSAKRVNKKIEQYTKDFVMCPVCKKPDTKLMKKDRVLFIKCLACGAKEPVKVKI